MKSLDVVVLCKIFLLQSRGLSDWTYSQLAAETCLSVGETHASVRRLKKSRLFDGFTKTAIPSAMAEFLVHGIKYAFPAEIGAPARGIATSHSAPILSGEFANSDSDKYVWSYAKGDQRGLSIKPLSENTPKASLKDSQFYDLLALVDAVRSGKSREKEMAVGKIVSLVLGKDANVNI
jgi:hypothetical protein